MSVPPTQIARPDIYVLVAGEQRLLCELVASLLREQEFSVHDEICSSPAMLERAASAMGGRLHQVPVLVDPLGEKWLGAAGRLRSQDRRLGLVVMTARPSYAVQRRWSRRAEGDLCLASALLSFDSWAGDLIEAIEGASRRPSRRTGFWLSGPRHPAAFHKTGEGKLASNVRRNEALHETLVLEGRGVPRKTASRRLGIAYRQVGERLGRLEDELEVKNGVQLGRRASELGLFEDVDW